MTAPEGSLPVEVYFEGTGALTYPMVRVTAKYIVVLTDPDNEKTTKFHRGSGEAAGDDKGKCVLMHASLALAEVLAGEGTWESGWEPSFYTKRGKRD